MEGRLGPGLQMSLITSDGILLRSHQYSESSRILRFLTPDLGIVSLIGKGMRTRGARGEASIQTFGEGSITFLYKPERDLHTLREIHPREGSLALGRGVKRFVGASLVAELLLSHNLEEGDRALYEWIRTVLHNLATAEESEVLTWVLAGGWRTLAELGFPPRLSECVRCDRDLSDSEAEVIGEGRLFRFDVGAGGVICAQCGKDTALPRVGPSALRDLEVLVEGRAPSTLRGSSAHLSLLERYAEHHLSPRRGFRSFASLRPLLNKTEESGYR